MKKRIPITFFRAEGFSVVLRRPEPGRPRAVSGKACRGPGALQTLGASDGRIAQTGPPKGRLVRGWKFRAWAARLSLAQSGAIFRPRAT